VTQLTDQVTPDDPTRPPRWLPPGSVRAIIVIVVAVFGRIALGLDVTEAAMNAALAIAGGYGAMRVLNK
jgi:hypothetical protein